MYGDVVKCIKYGDVIKCIKYLEKILWRKLPLKIILELIYLWSQGFFTRRNFT